MGWPDTRTARATPLTAMELTSRLIVRLKIDPHPCPKCGATPVQMRFALIGPASVSNERLRFECPACGRKGGKSASRIGAAKAWNVASGWADDSALPACRNAPRHP